MMEDSLIKQRFQFCKSVLRIVPAKVDFLIQQVAFDRFTLQSGNGFQLLVLFRG
jgi:hypothetical protein